MNTEDSQLLLDELADDFLLRLRNGESPKAEEYAERHPELATRLVELFKTLRYINDHQDLSSQFGDRPNWKRSGEAGGFPDIEDYKILREAGRGGMGIVYEAEQISLSRTVALKVLPQSRFQGKKSVARFYQEAKSAAGLHHTNIVPVYEVGKTEDTIHFYTMQFIRGQSLDQIVKDLRALQSNIQPGQPQTDPAQTDPEQSQEIAYCLLSSSSDTLRSSDKFSVQHQNPDQSRETEFEVKPEAETTKRPTPGSQGTLRLGDSSTKAGRRPFFTNVAHVGRETAQALHHAHDNGIIHRDIKPANLMLDSTGTVWVTDFGLAKTDDSQLTRTGDVVGTIRYMSPERFSGQCDAKSDIYSLGMTLYELLTQRSAFESSDRMSLIDSIKHQEPVALRTVDPRIPRDLETIIEKAIAKEPGRRYGSASDLADDLYRFIDGKPIKARRVSTRERVWLWARKRKALAAALAAFALLLTVSLFGAVFAAIHFRKVGLQQTELANQNLQLANENSRKVAEANEARNQMALSAKDASDSLRIFTDAFSSAHPDGDADAKMTAKDVLLNAMNALRDSAASPRIKNDFLKTLSQTFDGIGEYEVAYSLADEVWKANQADLGPDHATTLSSELHLATTQSKRGKTEEAAEILTDLLPRMEAALEPGHPDILSCRSNLAVHYQLEGDYQLALEQFEQLSEIRASGDTNLWLISRFNVGHVLWKMCELPRAIQTLENALVKGLAELPEDHPQILRTQSRLATVMRDSDRMDEAIEMYLATIEKQKQKMGEEHPDTLSTQSSLSKAYVASGRADEAIQMDREILATRTAKLGKSNRVTIRAMDRLAQAVWTKSRSAEALAMFKETYELSLAEFGDSDRLTLLYQNNLAAALLLSGQHEPARQLYEQEVSIRESLENGDETALAKSLFGLATSLLLSGSAEESVPLYRRSIKLYETTVGADYSESLMAMSRLSQALATIGEAQQAIEVLEVLVPLSVAKLGTKSAGTLADQNALANLYSQTGQFEKAVEIYERVLELAEDRFGRQHPNSQMVAANLGYNYLKTEQVEQAIPLLEEAYQTSKQYAVLEWTGEQLMTAYLAANKNDDWQKLAVESRDAVLSKHGKESPEYATISIVQGVQYLEFDQYSKAEELFRCGLEIRRQETPEHWGVANTMSLLGETLLLQQQFEQAKPLLVDGYKQLKETADSIPESVRKQRLKSALSRLVKLAELTEDTKAAQSWQKELEDLENQD